MTTNELDTRTQRHPLSHMFEWLQSQGTENWPFAERPTIPVEDWVEDDTYVLRAELPGVKPDEDIDLELQDDVLTITAQRREEQKDRGRREIRYGSFSRSLAVPAGISAKDIEARYEDGVLTVRVPYPATAPAKERIPINGTAH